MAPAGRQEEEKTSGERIVMSQKTRTVLFITFTEISHLAD